jgi:hypothetical protein
MRTGLYNQIRRVLKTLGSFTSIIAGSGTRRSTYPAVRICAAISRNWVPRSYPYRQGMFAGMSV